MLIRDSACTAWLAVWSTKHWDLGVSCQVFSDYSAHKGGGRSCCITELGLNCLAVFVLHIPISSMTSLPKGHIFRDPFLVCRGLFPSSSSLQNRNTGISIQLNSSGLITYQRPGWNTTGGGYTATNFQIPLLNSDEKTFRYIYVKTLTNSQFRKNINHLKFLARSENTWEYTQAICCGVLTCKTWHHSNTLPDFHAIMIKLMLCIISTPNDVQQQEIHLSSRC